MNTLEEQVLWSFDYFSHKTKNYELTYNYKLGKGEDKTLLKFINYLRKKYGELSIGKNWLFDYFTFQFEYWRTKYKRYYKGGGIIELSWIIGEKAIKRWEQKNDKWLYFTTIGIIKQFNLSSSEYALNFGQEILDKSNRGEIERGRFFNTERGFLNCIQNTAGYNNEINKCRICKFRLKCKKVYEV